MHTHTHTHTQRERERERERGTHVHTHTGTPAPTHTLAHAQVQSMQHVVDQLEGATATAGHYNEGPLMSEKSEHLGRYSYHFDRGPVWIDIDRG